MKQNMKQNPLKNPLQQQCSASHPSHRIALVTMGVKLGNELKGYTRFRFLANLLVENGFEVDLITSTFQHWEKAQRNTEDEAYKNLPYNVVFIHEPGYTKNLDLARIRSHHIAAKNLKAHFEKTRGRYNLIYSEIPPNDVARTCAEFASACHIPYVADINDLWPEAMRMVLDVPVLSSIAFWPFARDAKRTYKLLSGAVGTSEEYAARPAKDRSKHYARTVVYVGNNLKAFDAGAKKYASTIEKPASEFWVTYAGTLGASYDLKTLILAAVKYKQKRNMRISSAEEEGLSKQIRPFPKIRVKILGDGPNKESLEALAKTKDAPVDFLGYQQYEQMAAWLCASDVVVNSLVKTAAQSIVTKIGDYLASGKPMINTGSSPEFRAKVESCGFGVNVEAENPTALANAIEKLARTPNVCTIMGMRARKIAETEFDQRNSYMKIVNLIQNLL